MIKPIFILFLGFVYRVYGGYPINHVRPGDTIALNIFPQADIGIDPMKLVEEFCLSVAIEHLPKQNVASNPIVIKYENAAEENENYNIDHGSFCIQKSDQTNNTDTTSLYKAMPQDSTIQFTQHADQKSFRVRLTITKPEMKDGKLVDTTVVHPYDFEKMEKELATEHKGGKVLYFIVAAPPKQVVEDKVGKINANTQQAMTQEELDALLGGDDEGNTEDYDGEMDW